MNKSATFTGRLDVPAADLSFSKVAVYYSDAEEFNINDALATSTTTFDGQQCFSIILTGLQPNVKYNYCLIAKKIPDIDSENKFSLQITGLVPMTTYYYRSYVKMNGATVYSGLQYFKTLPYPYDVQSDLNVSLATSSSSLSDVTYL